MIEKARVGRNVSDVFQTKVHKYERETARKVRTYKCNSIKNNKSKDKSSRKLQMRYTVSTW